MYPCVVWCCMWIRLSASCRLWTYNLTLCSNFHRQLKYVSNSRSLNFLLLSLYVYIDVTYLPIPIQTEIKAESESGLLKYLLPLQLNENATILSSFDVRRSLLRLVRRSRCVVRRGRHPTSDVMLLRPSTIRWHPSPSVEDTGVSAASSVLKQIYRTDFTFSQYMPPL